MDEKLKMQHDAIEVEMAPLVHFPDVESGPPTPRLRSPSAEPRRFVGLISRQILLTLREMVRVANRSLKSGEPRSRAGVIANIFGFKASKNDTLRDTAWLDGLRGVAAFLVMVYRKSRAPSHLQVLIL